MQFVRSTFCRIHVCINFFIFSQSIVQLKIPIYKSISNVVNFELIAEHALVTLSDFILSLTIEITRGIITAL